MLESFLGLPQEMSWLGTVRKRVAQITSTAYMENETRPY